MEKVEYPKCKYHAEFLPVIVHSKEEEDLLGEGYLDSPVVKESSDEVKE